MNNQQIINNVHQHNVEIRNLANIALSALYEHRAEDCRRALLEIMAITDRSNRTLHSFYWKDSERNRFDQAAKSYFSMIDSVREYLYHERKRKEFLNTIRAI